jgi:hypothetical protein
MRINRTLFAFAAISFCMALQTGCTGKAALEETNQERTHTLASATEEINKRCPEWVDTESRLDSVKLLQKKQLHYYYTLPNKENASIGSNAFTAFLLPKIIENIHYNPDLKMHRDSGVVMYFIYHDRNGELITEFSVGPERYR